MLKREILALKLSNKVNQAKSSRRGKKPHSNKFKKPLYSVKNSKNSHIDINSKFETMLTPKNTTISLENTITRMKKRHRRNEPMSHNGSMNWTLNSSGNVSDLIPRPPTTGKAVGTPKAN